MVHRSTLVLDSVRSKENVGALFRTADAAGVSEVILCGITPQPVNRFGNIDSKIAKAALGAELYVPWRYAESCAAAVRELQKSGYTVIALEQTDTSVDYTAVGCDKNAKLALIVGNEVDGVSADVLRVVDVAIEIPMYGKKESLNVTVAAGIALYALRR
jgi:23S rRNA (guanosine2251-2'-O)-methyltransferase